jgi:MYXO-CTERM domain-containing protein
VVFSAGQPNTTITITDIYYGLVPAPGAVALVGVAGLVGSRRRRA